MPSSRKDFRACTCTYVHSWVCSCVRACARTCMCFHVCPCMCVPVYVHLYLSGCVSIVMRMRMRRRVHTALKASPDYTEAALCSSLADAVQGEKVPKARILRSHPTRTLTGTRQPFQLKYIPVSREFSTSLPPIKAILTQSFIFTIC